MMLVAVIADTHGRLPESVVRDIANADAIWHLGDFCDLKTLEAVRTIGPPVDAVADNNDFGLDLPDQLLIEIGPLRFHLEHIPPRRPPRKPPGDAFLHGHTHVPRQEIVDGVCFLNPGTIGKPNKGAPPSYAWLLIDPEQGEWKWTVKRIRPGRV